MYIPARLVFNNYVPQRIKEGMLFVTEQNSVKQVYELKDVPSDDDYNQFYAEHGYPVHPQIYALIDENPDEDLVLLADSDAIGLVEHENSLYDLSIDDMNTIMLEYGGALAIYMNEDEELDVLTPHLEDGKVVITWISNIYEEYDEDEEGHYIQY